jgi:hypothetical protein
LIYVREYRAGGVADAASRGADDGTTGPS